MLKDAYIAGVDAALVLGSSDANLNLTNDPSRVNPHFTAAYGIGYNVGKPSDAMYESIMGVAYAGWDDGYGNKPKRPYSFDDLYEQSYAAGAEEIGVKQPPSSAEASTSHTVLAVGLAAAAVALVGIGYALSRRQTETFKGPRYANPVNDPEYTHYLVLDNKILSGWSFKEDAKDAKQDLPVEWQKDTKILSKKHLKSIGVDPDYDDNWSAGRPEGHQPACGSMANPESRPGHVHLQGVGWVPGKAAGLLQPGDRLMWNYGETSVVEHVERSSAQFVTVTERYENGKTYSRKLKVDRLVAMASRPNPSSKKFVVVLNNMDNEDGMVVATVSGPGAAAWAKDDQSIAGSRWETDGPDFAYAMPMDQPKLVEELKAEGYELDLDSYWPPEE